MLKINVLPIIVYLKLTLFIILTPVVFQKDICYAQNNEVHPEIEKILQKGTLNIAMHSMDTKPFYSQNENGELTGFDADIAKDIAIRLGVDLKFNRTADTFNEVVDLIVREEADIAISSLSNTLSRAMKVRFSEPYITLYRTLAVNRLEFAKRRTKKNANIKNELQLILSLEDIKIGVVDGSAYIDFAKEDFPNAHVVPYKDWDSVMQAVSKREVFAGMYDNNEAEIWSYDHPESAIFIKTILLKEKKDTLSFAVHNKNEYLFHWLNLYLRKIMNDGTYDALIKKYFPGQQINSD